jgi:hypothetical protein
LRYHYEATEKFVISQERLAPDPGTHEAGTDQGCLLIPKWLADWVMEEGDEGRKIEKALIEYYGLVPPAKTVIISNRL